MTGKVVLTAGALSEMSGGPSAQVSKPAVAPRNVATSRALTGPHSSGAWVD